MILWVGEQPALRRDPLFVFNNLAQEEKWVIFFLKDTQWLNKMMMREKLNYLFYKSVVKGMVSREKYGVFQFETLVRPNNDPRIGITFLRKAGTCFDKPPFWNASLSLCVKLPYAGNSTLRHFLRFSNESAASETQPIRCGTQHTNTSR